MSEAKFTKGPWTSSLLDYHSEDPTVLVISGSDNNDVCEILNGSVEDADLALILAAPDMYEALEEVETFINNSVGIIGYHLNGSIAEWDDLDATRVINNALRKARGETE